MTAGSGAGVHDPGCRMYADDDVPGPRDGRGTLAYRRNYAVPGGRRILAKATLAAPYLVSIVQTSYKLISIAAGNADESWADSTSPTTAACKSPPSLKAATQAAARSPGTAARSPPAVCGS